MVRSVVFLALLAGAVAATAKDANPTETFKQGVALVEKYIALVGRGNSAPATEAQRSELRKGIALLEQVIVARPGHWQALWFAGKGQQALGDHAAAYASFGRAYAIESANPNVGRELVIEAICVRETAHAAKIALELSRAHPQDAGLMANAGLALLTEGRHAEAQAQVAMALRLDPADSVTQALNEEVARVMHGGKPLDYCPDRP